ncbi:hypothetical protein, partial [Shouchella clausii]
KKVLYVGTESRNTDNGTFHQSSFVDPNNKFERIQVNVDQEQLANMPSINSEVDLKLALVQRNYRTYTSIKDLSVTAGK